MAIEKGDFILIDYVAYVKETGQVIDLTIEEEAKKRKFYRKDGIYEPELLIVGEGWMPKGLEEALVGLEVGVEKNIELPPEKAFGPRDPSKVRIVPARELTRRGITPRVGELIELNGVPAVIRSVGGGRVQLDFNHPLAGKTLVYEVKIVKKLESIEDKALELLRRRLRRLKPENVKISFAKESGKLRVELPLEASLEEDFGYALLGYRRDVEKYLPEACSLEVVFSFEIPREKEEARKGVEEKKEKEEKKEEKKPEQKKGKRAKGGARKKKS